MKINKYTYLHLISIIICIGCEISKTSRLDNEKINLVIENSSPLFKEKNIVLQESITDTLKTLNLIIENIDNNQYDETIKFYKAARKSSMLVFELEELNTLYNTLEYRLIGKQPFLIQNKFQTDALEFEFTRKEFLSTLFKNKYDFLSFLGKSLNDNLLSEIKKEKPIYLSNYEVCFFQHGVSITVISDTITSIHFYNKSQNGFNEFVGVLPLNLNFDQNKENIYEVFGSPNEIDGNIFTYFGVNDSLDVAFAISEREIDAVDEISISLN